MYQSLTGEITGVMLAFSMWFYVKHKEILIAKTPKQLESFYKLSKDIDVEDRASFLEAGSTFESRRTTGKILADRK